MIHNAQDSMQRALGGETEEKHYDLATAVAKAQPGGDYSGQAEYVAKMILQAARRDPIAFAEASEKYRDTPLSGAIEDLMTDEERTSMDGITGFMWGWAVNAAFYLTEQAAGPNPALVTIGRRAGRA